MFELVILLLLLFLISTFHSVEADLLLVNLVLAVERHRDLLVCQQITDDLRDLLYLRIQYFIPKLEREKHGAHICHRLPAVGEVAVLLGV